MSLRDGWSRETFDLESQLEHQSGYPATVLTLAREMREKSDSPMTVGMLDQIIAVHSVVHLGESDERCSTLCGEPPVWSGANIDPDHVTWTDDGSWIDTVTCRECLRLAVKIGDDARARIAQLAE